MSEPLDLHNKATEKAFLANQAKTRNDFLEYLQLSKEAFVLEKEACLLLKDSFKSEPTRSVLFRSAASLALNCGEYDEAIKLISYALIGQPHSEIKSELFEILRDISQESENSSGVENKDNAYLEFLREKAINIKIEPKANFYSRAIAVDAIVETLKNVKASLSNYIEVNFKKDFAESDFNDFDTVLAVVKKDYSPLCVNLSFKSFSASICVDDRVTFKEDNSKVLRWKENLFESFKQEVIEIDYQSRDSLQQVLTKYSDVERNLIFNPIIDSVKEKNRYKISITDRDFKHIEKSLTPISKPIQEILTPKIRKPEQPREMVLVQSYALVEDPKSLQKRDIFESHELDYAEFSKIINEVSNERKEYLVVRNPFDIKIVYRKPEFNISDDLFAIYTRAATYEEVLKSYNRILIELYKKINNQDERNLSVDELEVKRKMMEIFSFSSQNE